MAKKFLPESRYTRETMLKDEKTTIVHVRPLTYSSAGLLVHGENFEGLIPPDEITIYSDEQEKTARVLVSRGDLITAKIVEAPTSGLILLSRKQSMADALQEIVPGKVLSAKITNYGRTSTFLDIGAGICAVLPISEICQVHIEPDEVPDRFSGFDSIKVKVLDESLQYSQKFVVSYKAAFKPLSISEGDVVRGKIHSTLPDGTGTLVELSPVQSGIVDIGPNNCSWVQLKKGWFYNFKVKRVRPKSNGYLHYSLELIE